LFLKGETIEVGKGGGRCLYELKEKGEQLPDEKRERGGCPQPRGLKGNSIANTITGVKTLGTPLKRGC